MAKTPVYGIVTAEPEMAQKTDEWPVVMYEVKDVLGA